MTVRLIGMVLLLALLSGCAKGYTELPLAPEREPVLRAALWPQREFMWRFHGALHFRSVEIPAQGIAAVSPKGDSITVALVTLLGTSIIEAEISDADAVVAARSPLLQKYPALEDAVLDMLRAAFLPLADTQPCRAEADDARMQLFCPDIGTLYVFLSGAGQPDGTEAPRLSQCPRFYRKTMRNGDAVATFSDWKTAGQDTGGTGRVPFYPQHISYEASRLQARFVLQPGNAQHTREVSGCRQ